MQLSTTIRSPGLLVLGLGFAGVTAATIFSDVLNGAQVTIAHLNSAAALVAAIAAGHMAWPQLKQGRVPDSLLLAVIFVAATSYIVTASGSRNAEASQSKAAVIVKTNAERAALRLKLASAEADLENAKADHEKAKAAATSECATGKGKRCDGKTASRDSAALDVEKADAFAMLQSGRIALLGPEEQPNAGYAHAAKVAEAFGLGKALEIEARLVLILPFLTVLISEACTLVFIGMALGHRDPSSQQTSQQAMDAELAELRRKFFEAEERFAPSEPQPSAKPAPSFATNTATCSEQTSRIGRAEQVKTFCTLFRQQQGREPTFSEVRDGLRLPAATASKYRRAALG